jgi:hypothetical protein
MAAREVSAVDWPAVATPIAAVQGWRPQAVPAQPDPHLADWAGAGFSQPGPVGHSVPSRELYRAALKDALAYTADRDGCGECDGAQLCETHTSRAARAEQYEWALEREMEPTTRTDKWQAEAD